MSDSSNFKDLLQKAREGDQDAASELVKQYEPAIRRAVRFRMTDTRLGARFDSVDVCQSVMVSFFVRAAHGEYDLESPEQLMKLLLSMAKNKLAMQVRKQKAQQRDIRRGSGEPAEEHQLAGAASTPSQQLAAREILEAVQNRLTPEEQELVELRNQGTPWNEIAEKLGGSPEALRKKLTRALDRISGELGLDSLG